MSLRKVIVIGLIMLLSANAREIAVNDISSEPEITIYSDASFKPFAKCSFSSDFVQSMGCAAARALKVVNEINKKATLQILPGVTLNSDEPLRQAKAIKELNLPEDPKAKTIALMEHLLDESAKLVTSRSINVKFPETETQSLARTIEEGRGKMKKMMMPMLLAIGGKLGVVMPILIAGVGFLAAKAAVVAKIALGLVLALLIPTMFSNIGGGFFQNIKPFKQGFLGGGFGGYGPPSYGGGYGDIYPTYGVPSGGWTTNHLGGPYARTFTVDDSTSTEEINAQNLAYSSYEQK